MDYKELIDFIIKNNLGEYVLQKLGCHSFIVSNKVYSSEIRAALPDDDDNTKISINLSTLKVRVFTKKESVYGNIYNLIMYILNCSFSEAVKWCSDVLNISHSYTKKRVDHISFYKKIKKYSDIKTGNQLYYDKSILNNYIDIVHIDLIKNDGIISLDIIKKYEIKFDDRTDRIIFPHFKYDDKTLVAGVIGRTVNRAYKELKMPKYLSLLPTEYLKQQNLYGFSHNIDNIKKFGIIIVFEAEKSVLKLDMFGLPVGVSVGCHEISKFQKQLLISLNVEICIAFDTDVDSEHIKNTCKDLSYFSKVSYIKDDWSLLKEKDSPVDRGYKKWNFLFKHRKIFNGK